MDSSEYILNYSIRSWVIGDGVQAARNRKVAMVSTVMPSKLTEGVVKELACQMISTMRTVERNKVRVVKMPATMRTAEEQGEGCEDADHHH